jgi:glycosyltransferase involved in cell wall biosynthesis
MAGQAVYVVDYRSNGIVNERVARVLTLGERTGPITLVAGPSAQSAGECIRVRPIPNPTGILRVLGLSGAQRAIDSVLLFPSRQILWVKPAQRVLKRRIAHDLAHGRRVCVLTCAPPHDACLVGLRMKELFPEIRWCIDWQDLWSYDENYFGRIPAFYRERALRLERKLFAASDMNVTTNAYAKRVLEDHFGVPASKVVAIHHPFHPEDLPPTAAQPARPGAGGTVSIGFLGALFKPPRVPGHRVVEAVRQARQAGLDVELHLYGDRSQSARDLLAEMPDGGLVLHERTSHREALRRIGAHDFLLLALADLANCRAVMSIKLPHYLLVGRPIIAIVPEPSAVAEIVRETGAGYVVRADEDWGEGLLRALKAALAGDGPLVRNEEAISRYSWDRVSRQWIDLLGAPQPHPYPAAVRSAGELREHTD